MMNERTEGWITQVRKGLLELSILNFLREDSLYGYEIIKRLNEIPQLVITEGTIYPILNRLKREGLIDSHLKESDRGPVRKYYKLTAEGKKQMADMNTHWNALKQAISRIVKKI